MMTIELFSSNRTEKHSYTTELCFSYRPVDATLLSVYEGSIALLGDKQRMYQIKYSIFPFPIIATVYRGDEWFSAIKNILKFKNNSATYNDISAIVFEMLGKSPNLLQHVRDIYHAGIAAGRRQKADEMKKVIEE